MMTRNSQLRFAIIGGGRFGSYIARLLQDRVDAAEVTALVEPDAVNRDAFVATCGTQIPTFCSLDELLRHHADHFDAALIATPNHEHCQQTIAAANAGKHVFCEKPMALTSEECKRMVQAAQRKRVRLMVGHKRRLRPTWKRLTDLVHGGEIGIVRAVNINGWHYHAEYPEWYLRNATGGGLLHLAGVHEIDYFHALLGESLWVRAIAGLKNRSLTDFNDTMWVTIGFATGAVASLQVSLGYESTHFRESFCVQVQATNGSAFLIRHHDEQQELKWNKAGEPSRQEWFIDDASQAYLIEMNSFIEWVLSGVTPVLSWREGSRCVQVMEAAYRSAQEDGEKIHLPPIE